MRIAIAGGRGLGYLLAAGLSRAASAHNLIVLSRTANVHEQISKHRREIEALRIQVHVVDYINMEMLRFALSGIDLVISTISGQAQLNLINAAGHGRVSYFVPSEFEGSLTKRPPGRSDPLDRGGAAALTLLRQWADTGSRMKWTAFSCGIFMERFHPYGLAASLGIGVGEGVGTAGSYVADINNGIAEYTSRGADGHSVKICLTSVLDVVRFVIAAIELDPSTWPAEFTMRGDRLKLTEVVDAISAARNVAFQSTNLNYQELASQIAYNTEIGNYSRAAYLQRNLETANGRYDFSRASLNEAVDRSRRIRVHPVNFAQWLATVRT